MTRSASLAQPGLEHRLRQDFTQGIINQAQPPPIGLERWLLELVLSLPLRRIARLAQEFDRQVGEVGLRMAAQRLLPSLVQGVQVVGPGMPESGPLLLVSNHPSTIDTLLLAAHLPREDVRILTQDIPSLHSLPNTQKYLIFLGSCMPARLAALRLALRHLKAGGVLLVHPSGRLDPDPLTMHGAWESINRWSASPGVFLRCAPGSQVQVALLGGLIDQKSLELPLVRSISSPSQRQVAAELAQVTRQVLFGGPAWGSPRLYLGEPLGIQDLSRDPGLGMRNSLVHSAQRLLVTNVY